MSIQKWGGLAAITLALTYVFGFVLFFGLLDTSGLESHAARLAYMVEQRDTYFFGYLVIGVLFSFVLLVLVQSIYRCFRRAPELTRFTAAVGYLWAFIVLASSFIFLTSLEMMATYHAEDPQQALAIHRAINIVVNALGGGIELVGAVWVLAISYMGLRERLFSPLLHYWGIIVGIAGVLTLFSGLSFLSANPLFEVTTAIFGLGQILWFLLLGATMLRAQEISSEPAIN